MELTSVHLVRLALLMLAVGALTLGACLVVAYRHSARLFHVVPLAVAYMWISVIVALRGWDMLEYEAALWHAVGAFTVGNVGLVRLLMMPFPPGGRR